MENNYLNKVYDVSTSDSRELYASWSTTYDQEVIENGYATPDRIAKALKEYASDKSTLILDYGCGTGLSGLALQSVGFKNLDGLDVSKEMVRIAEKKSIYKSLKVFDPDTKIPIYSEQYKIITAIGVIGAGAAPLKVFDDLFSLLPPSGLFAFSFNDHTLGDPIYEEKVEYYVDSGRAAMLHKNYGSHLPKANLKSNIYILKKL